HAVARQVCSSHLQNLASHAPRVCATENCIGTRLTSVEPAATGPSLLRAPTARSPLARAAVAPELHRRFDDRPAHHPRGSGSQIGPPAFRSMVHGAAAGWPELHISFDTINRAKWSPGGIMRAWF